MLQKQQRPTYKNNPNKQTTIASAPSISASNHIHTSDIEPLISLDERKDDIPVLTTHFNKQICGEHGIAEKTFSPKALEVLQSYTWSGNIREFRNVIERLIILCSDTVSKEDVESFAGKQ